MTSKVYDLEYSDTSFGHLELGYAEREDCRDPDEEEARLLQVMKKQGIQGRVAGGRAYIDHIPAPDEMTDDQLTARLEACDPDAEHDDLHEPNGPMADYWREADRRGLMNPVPTVRLSDDDLRNRILEVLPQGAVYTAEDVGNTSGEALDDLASAHGVSRIS